MKVLSTLLLLAAVVVIAQAGFNDAVQQLAKFQDPQTGAFHANANSAPTLEATTDALFLSSLYGLGTKINSFQAEQYLQSLRTKENGYSSTPSGSPTMEATYNAVVSHVHLGKEVPQADAVVKYVLSLADSSNLFSNNAGGRGNIKSTYHAIATLAALDAIESLPSDLEAAIVDLLQNSFVAGSAGKYFSFTNVPAIKSNFYGTYIWSVLNEDALSAEENFNFILSQQNPRGGFFSDLQHVTSNYESAALALRTLGLLSAYSDAVYTDKINTIALARYCNEVPADLSESAAAHSAVAHTSHFSENFKFIVEYGGADTRGTHVLQGTQLRPELIVRSFHGPSHANLDVNVKYTIDGVPKTSRMVWDEENQKYVAPQVIDTSNMLGKIAFSYDMNIVVFGVEPINFAQSADKHVGYRVNIFASAVNQNTGASVDEGEAVSVGTEFDFDVKLANKTHSNIKAGDFYVTFNGYDSSFAVIAKESVNAVDNADAFHFSYVLTDNNIPSGELTFLIGVENAEGVAFSNDAVYYTISTPMVASEIEFNENSFTLGSFFSVSIVPGSSPDLVEVFPITVDASVERKFVLDIATSSGVVVRSVNGVPSEGKYDFDFTIPSSYDSLGSFVASFRYESAKGESIALDNIVDGEVSEDALVFSVDAELEAEILEQPESTKFFYGNDVTYKFKVNDKLTGSSVALGNSGGVFLTLNHYDSNKGKSFVSTKLPAVQVGDELVVNWKVNPNAASGDGNVVLIAEGPGGDELPLLVNGKQYSVDVNIGGDIKNNVRTFSSDDFYSSQTAFIVEFDLSCNDVPLRDVKLTAVVFYEGEEINSTPVGVFEDKYIASWNSLHIDSPSGAYEVKFYREADQQRASDNEEWKQKQLRAKQRDAELSGEKFDEQKFLNSLESVELEPLFSVTVPHSMVSRGGLPFGSEWLVLIPITIGFLYFDNVKRQYKKGARK